MIKIFFLFVITCLFSVNKAYSQLEVYGLPLDTIEKFVKDQPEMFDELKERVMNVFLPLSQEDAFLFYYGSAFLNSYSPYGESIQNEAIKKAKEENDYEKIIEISKASIRQNPAVLKNFSTLGNAYYNLSDSTMSEKYYTRYFELLRIPFYSGTGNSFDSAFVVRSISDEYIILGELNYIVGTQSLLTDDNGYSYDKFDVTDEDGNKKEVYFNIYLPFNLGMANMFKDAGLDEKPLKKSKKKSKTNKKKKKI